MCFKYFRSSYLVLVDQSHFRHVYVEVVDVRQADFHVFYLESTIVYVTLGNCGSIYLPTTPPFPHLPTSPLLRFHICL